MRVCPSCGERGGSVAYPKCTVCKTYTVEEKINTKGEGMTDLNVYQKLADVRILLQGTVLKKSGENKFAKYKYFELGDFLPTINKLFHDAGLIGIISFGDYAELCIVNMNNIEETISFCSPMSSAALKGCHDVQNLGAVQTYLRRYLYMNALEIVEHDALDSSEPRKETKKQPAAKKPIEAPDPRIAELGGMVKEMAAKSMCAPSVKLKYICGLETFKGVSSVTVDEIEPKIHEHYTEFLEGKSEPFNVDCPEKMLPKSMADCDACSNRENCPSHEKEIK